MKKKLGAFFVAFVLGGVIFAENYTKGIDLHLLGSPIGRTKMTVDNYGVEYIQKSLEAGYQFKLATYDCFLLNDMFGVYGAFGVNFGAYLTASPAEEGGDELDDIGLKSSFEFMIGPAFGVNLGRIRFQTGLAFHAVFGKAIGLGTDSDAIKTTALGIALTPQFRFGANKRCSFLLGCDIAFDFPKKLTYVYGSEKTVIKFDKGFRFGTTPYIGLGINF